MRRRLGLGSYRSSSVRQFPLSDHSLTGPYRGCTTGNRAALSASIQPRFDVRRAALVPAATRAANYSVPNTPSTPKKNSCGPETGQGFVRWLSPRRRVALVSIWRSPLSIHDSLPTPIPVVICTETAKPQVLATPPRSPSSRPVASASELTALIAPLMVRDPGQPLATVLGAISTTCDAVLPF